MYYQNKKGFYTYHYDCIGTLISKRYPTLEDFFKHHSEFFIKSIIVNEIGKHLTRQIDGNYFSGYATVIYDENSTMYTKDRILGLYRNWKSKRISDYDFLRFNKMTGRKHSVYGWYRSIHTYPEMREWFNVDEYNIRGRARRSKAMLPESWDDISRHVEKSWKNQSKNRHQYN